ncbi:peptidylprolyl isomerase [Moorena producens JHB]|uniref:peptidylprolyl isomerase n=1 Tax=Moorena producens (strain JHB) TaxID=1454205 RepID=A0A1D9G9G8_MOOP1|nr:peptidylprolyl isomerase [Moorena producens]AOY84125.1 peptidylprolyl isomerase [Moorena producens JHB]
MTQTTETLEKPLLPKTSPATDADIIAYLRRSRKFGEIASFAEQDALILDLCEELSITVSDQEWQAAGDAFRVEHKLLGVTETNSWFSQQRITVEEWSEGIKVQLLTKKLKEHLFGEAVDGDYISNRENYRRVALSQILVLDLAQALKIVKALRYDNASFCALALEHSKGKQSQENGGFVGIRFLAELSQDIAKGIYEAKEGEVIGPIQTKLGYHILRVEKWFPTELNESVREAILEFLFQNWLQEQSQTNPV